MSKFFKTVVSIFLLLSVVGLLSCNSVERELTKLAEKANVNLPKKLDEETVFDKAASLGNKTYQFQYTLQSSAFEDASQEALDYSVFRIKNAVIERLKTETANDVVFLLKNKVTIKHSYYNKKRDLIFEITITPDDYK